jgi:hypothetical protein
MYDSDTNRFRICFMKGGGGGGHDMPFEPFVLLQNM